MEAERCVNCRLIFLYISFVAVCLQSTHGLGLINSGCVFDPCKNGANCIDGQDGRYVCKCLDGWKGPNCDEDINECIKDVCTNGGTCENLIGSYRCYCPPNWTGPNCRTTHCRDALGMQSMAIPDSSITASSSFDKDLVGPRHARIRTEINGGAWCPKNRIERDSYEYLQIDLGNLMVITIVEIQGRFGNGQGQEFTEEFRLEYQRENGGNWIRFKNVHGEEVFRGNENTYLSETRIVSPPIIGRGIRFIPVATKERTVCMRVEMYGCQWEAVADGEVPDDQDNHSNLDNSKMPNKIDSSAAEAEVPDGQANRGNLDKNNNTSTVVDVQEPVLETSHDAAKEKRRQMELQTEFYTAAIENEKQQSLLLKEQYEMSLMQKETLSKINTAIDLLLDTFVKKTDQ